MKISSRKSSRGNEPAVKKKAASKKVKSAGGGSGKGKKIGIAAAIAVGVLLAVFVGMGVYAGSVEQIFPNVALEDIDLSGMTMSDAADALSRSSFADEEDRELMVTLPAETELVVSAKAAGCYLSAPEAAVFVYEYCHGGGFFANTITYWKCVLGGAQLTVGDGAQLNEEYLQSAVDEAVRQAHLALLESSVEIGEESISVIKGAGSAQIDSGDLYETVKLAITENNFEPIEYSAVSANGQEHELDIDHLYDTVFSEPVNAVYDPATQGATQSEVGRSFDKDEAQRLWDAASVGERVVIPLIITEPEVSTEKLSGMLFADLLAQKSTGLGGSSYARINNITKASASINGLVLNPGDEFSYNGTVGQRTAAAGYMAAGAYNNGQVVQEIGGGICQVSSTLYYCALMSNLEITNRLCHYFGVDYLPAGLDATVSWPSPDFKFRNDGDYPIRIEAYVDTASHACVIKIYGSNPDGIRVEMTTEPTYYTDGYGADSYRWVYDRNGNLISKTKEASSRYYYHTADSPEPEPSPSPSTSPSTSPSPSQNPTTPPPATPSPSVPVDPPPPTNVPDPGFTINPEEI